MKKKIYTIGIMALFIIAMLLPMNSVTAEDNAITIEDASGDVINSDTGETTDVPNIDIIELSGTKTNKEIEIQLKIVPEGVIELNENTIYTIILITTKSTYFVLISPLISQAYPGSGDILILDENMEDINETIEPNSFSGIGTDTFSVKFDLSSTNERVLTLTSEADKTSELGALGFADIVPNDDQVIVPGLDAGGPYNSVAGEEVDLSGSIEEGEASDFNWIWVFDENDLELEGPNPSHTFKIPGEYEGTLYIYDSKGNYDEDYFSVEVNSTGGNGGNGNKNDNGTPGFEIITLIAALAIALIILRKKSFK